jgi:toxin-antitoxin system PIN domain toxin
VQLVDANVLLYAVNPATTHHKAARAWLDDALDGHEPVGLAWTTLLAFIRISTSPAIFDRPLDARVACDVVRGWLARPAALVVEPTTRHIDVLAGLLAEAGTAGNLVGDAHVAALAVEHGATVVTFDADFARFAGVRWVRPAL